MSGILNTTVIEAFPEARIVTALAVLLASIIVPALFLLLARPVPVPALWQGINLVFGKIGDRLDRESRPAPDLFFRGFLLTVVVFFVVVGVFAGLAYVWPYPAFDFVWEGLVLFLLMSAPLASVYLGLLYRTLTDKKTGQGVYLALARGAQVDFSAADDYTLTRAALGLAARRFNDALVMPLLWYCALGLEVALLASIFAALAWRYGAAGLKGAFGMFASGCAFVLGFIPSVISACLLWLAAWFTPGAKKGRLARLESPYHQGGLVLGVMATALNVTLGGTLRRLGRNAVRGQWVGPEGASAKVEPYHLKRGIYLLGVAHLLLILLLCSSYLVFV